MTNTLRHRGPDGSGIRLFTPEDCEYAVALGHRRLAVIDLSEAGLQPMANEDGTVWIVFNGEIYNFRELKEYLLARGHRFKSATDTEVLVHLYEELGAGMVAKLNGIFAFAILDKKAHRLLLARDPLGVKPLYYSVGRNGLAFGSEIKALLCARDSAPNVNWQAIYDYFTFLYIPGPQTAFEEIEQLSPAHTLVYDLNSGRCDVNRYWTVKQRDEVAHSTRKQIEEELVRALEGAVRRELVSDVPLGLFLSGGVDSSVLAAVASHSGVSPHTFTVDFSNPESRYYSEAETAAETSRFLNTKHQRLVVDSIEPLEMLNLVDYFDEPFGNPTSYLQWLIAKRAREHITVALSGAGGDELFAGYPRYRAAQLSGAAHRIPYPVLNASRRALRLLKDDYRTMRLRRIREFLDGLDPDPVREFTHWTYFMTAEDKTSLLTDHGGRHHPSERHLRTFYDESPLRGGNRLLHMDVQSFLVDNLLVYTDRMSMAVGMEVRVPMLEPEFVEYALNVPFRWKLRARETKAVLRHAFRPLLTKPVREGSKRGFNAPLALWVRGPLDSYFVASQQGRHPLKDLLGEDIGVTWQGGGPLNWSYVDRMRRAHSEGRQDLSHELYAVIAFDVWWRKYVSGTLPISAWSPEGADQKLPRDANAYWGH